jgi:hypothetical protein
MACQHCDSGSGVYDMSNICCAARFIDNQVTNICRKYGHTRAGLRQAMAEVKRAERAPDAGTEDR